MLTISLEQLRFHSPIGLYPEEKILGNDFLMDVHLHLKDETKEIESLAQTVDYVKAYELIKKEMQQERNLIESAVQNCMESLKNNWPQIAEAEIIIRKLHPPMQGDIGCSKITLSKKF